MITETSLIDLERTYTTAEFEELASDGNFYELIEGKLHLSPATGDEHGRIRQRIVRQLHRFDPSGKLGEDWQNTHFLISSTFEPAPDFAFVVANRVPPVRQGTVEVVPDLVVEVLSPGDIWSEIVKKIQLYLQAGVKLVWVVDPFDQGIFVYRLNQPCKSLLLLNNELDGEDVIPGFKMKVAELFQ